MTISNPVFIQQARLKTKAFWEAYQDLKDMQEQWNALDYGNNLENGVVLAADVGAVIFGTMDAVKTLLATGHATNLAKLL